MNTQGNKAIAFHFHELFDKGDFEGMRSLLSPDVKAYFTGAEGAQDRAAFEGAGKMFLSAFSQSRHEIGDQVAEGDRVASRFVWSAIQSGDFNGVPPTGRPIKMDIFIIDRIVDGKIIEHRGYFDLMGLLQQIGAMPVPAAA